MVERDTSIQRQVIFRIDYAQPAIVNTEDIDHIRKMLEVDYPERETQTRVNFEVSFERSGKTMKEIQSPVVILNNKLMNNRIIFEQGAIAFDIQSYEDFSKLRDQIQLVCSTLQPKNPELIIGRIGLRHIYQIILKEDHPFDWSDKISKRLLCGIDYLENRKCLTRAMGVIEFEEDDCRVKFQYGMFNSEYPNRITKKEFALDFDCYCSTKMALSSIPSELTKFNELIDRLYQRSKAENLKKDGE